MGNQLNKISPKESAGKTTQKKTEKKNSKTLAQIVNGDFLKRDFVLNNLTYIFFVLVLLIILVGKGYYVSQLSKNIENTEKEVNQMNSDYVEAKAKLEEQTRRAKLVEQLTPQGLKETLKPTKVIRVEKEK
jgi:Na+-transporting methylmalonyl-CoA/oxaloacetate decarboxylase gamma subunit